ncbi:beta-hexosaminidase subunit beta-like isoform X2 [Haemaphysalis longicornis]
MADRTQSWLPLISTSRAGIKAARHVPCYRAVLYAIVAAVNVTQRPPRLLLQCLPRRQARNAWRALQLLVAVSLAFVIVRNRLLREDFVREDRTSLQEVEKLQMGLNALPSLWPAPQRIDVPSVSPTRVIDYEHFRITSYADCDVVMSAMARYRRILALQSTGARGQMAEIPAGLLTRLRVVVKRYSGQDCEYPAPKANESYVLSIPAVGDAALTAETVWGALRGLETFSQMVQAHPLARYDAMAYNKFNVLHWHIVDDQSWPIQMKRFPNLTEVGAYSRRHVYSPEDVSSVIEYARLRGIRVIPELDTPGHTQALGKAFPDVLTPCYGYGVRGRARANAHAAFEILDPTQKVTYNVVQGLVSEFVHVFKDPYVHLGMDEVYYDCWKSNPEVLKFISQHGLRSISHLEQLYVQSTLNNLGRTGAKFMIWQDPMDNGVRPPEGTVVQVWKSRRVGQELEWPVYAYKHTGNGYEVVVSGCWYLDHFDDIMGWESYYDCEPRAFDGTAKQKALVLGGEACIWGEFVDQTNLLSALWPRASAVAERLWSNRHLDSSDKAAPRLNAQRCRMLRRGIPVHPLNSLACDDDEEIDFKEVFELD